MSSTASRSKKALLGVSLGALGIVYGDIGTSPLYAMNEIFFGHAHTAATHGNVIGTVSVIVWALLIIVALKYMLLVLRADSEGEGGVFALLALLHKHRQKMAVGTIILFLIVAAGFLYGDGLITPAISVLSATEGLKLITPAASHVIVPLTIAILAGLFTIQKKGTAQVGRLFGPVMMLWFLAISLLGINQIIQSPGILASLNPAHAISFVGNMAVGKLLVILGSVMLVVTGGEAVFADMGHFGRTPIRLSWFSIVMPSLLLSYMGQGAYLLGGHTVQNDNLFYSLVPHSLLIPAVILATFATVIASQALISGAFSLTSQAIALELLPKMRIFHTHEHHEGQIYLPFINWLLFSGCVLIVIAFKSSNALASAYGLAVSVVMVVTSLAMILVAKLLWKWSTLRTVLVWMPLLLVDCLFLTANSLKLLEGGFVPVIIGIVLANVMLSWRWGRNHVLDAYSKTGKYTMQNLVDVIKNEAQHFPKSMLILTASKIDSPDDKIPAQLQLFFDKFGLFPEHMVILRVAHEHKSHIESTERYSSVIFSDSPHRQVIAVTVKYGFMETINLENALRHIANANDLGVNDDLANWLILASNSRIAYGIHLGKFIKRLRYLIFTLLSRNARPTFEYYGLENDDRLVIENMPITFDGA
jgi:KUP system potassium uptake protein